MNTEDQENKGHEGKQEDVCLIDSSVRSSYISKCFILQDKDVSCGNIYPNH